jgi:uncharacterized protein YcaQ
VQALRLVFYVARSGRKPAAFECVRQWIGLVLAGRRGSVRRCTAGRLLSPFDPVVWDRGRFEASLCWVYRFEASTPAPKRKRGYYALPLVWRDRVIGWGNLSRQEGVLKSEFGYVESAPRDRACNRGLEAELDHMRAFLGLES